MSNNGVLTEKYRLFLKFLSKKMIENQLKANGIVDENILNAFSLVPRHCFVPESMVSRAYENYDIPLDCGQIVPCAYKVALALQQLNLSQNDTVLEIQSNSGYQTAILSQLVKKVYVYEQDKNILAAVKDKVKGYDKGNVEFINNTNSNIAADIVLAINKIITPEDFFGKMRAVKKILTLSSGNCFDIFTD